MSTDYVPQPDPDNLDPTIDTFRISGDLHERAVKIIAELVAQEQNLIVFVKHNVREDVMKALGAMGIERVEYDFSLDHRTRDEALTELVLDSVTKIFPTDRKDHLSDVLPKHLHSVGDLSKAIAMQMGLGEFADSVSRGGNLHDVGKVDDDVNTMVSKHGELDDYEREGMELHSELGALVLKYLGSSDLLQNCALLHHENIDGSGYPNKLKDGDIPLEARIVSVADTVDAMLADRPRADEKDEYGLPLSQVVKVLSQKSGSKYDPTAVDAFLAILKRAGYMDSEGKLTIEDDVNVKTSDILEKLAS